MSVRRYAGLYRRCVAVLGLGIAATAGLPSIAMTVTPQEIYDLFAVEPSTASGRWCGTYLSGLVREHWSELDPERIPSRYHPSAETMELDRPEDDLGLLQYPTDDGHFMLHYAETGVHAIQGWDHLTPLEKVAEFGAAFEAAYSKFRDELGLPAPLSDGTRGGGIDRIDVYIYRLENQRIFGSISGETPLIPGRCPLARAGLARLQSDLPLYGDAGTQAHLTAAHELFHVFQYGLHSWSSSWLVESTAEWSETVAFPPEVLTKDYGFLRRWFDTSYLPLWSTGPEDLRQYASLHYWEFLEQFSRHQGRSSRSFVGEVWCNTCDESGKNWFWGAALDRALSGLQPALSFDETLVEFSIWNHDPAQYIRGRSVPEIRVTRRHPRFDGDAYPVNGDVPSTDFRVAQEAGSNYLRFGNPAPGVSPSILRVDFDGGPGVPRVVSLLKRRHELLPTEPGAALQAVLVGEPIRKFPDLNGDVRFLVEEWDQLDDVMMIVTNFESATGDLGYRYSARELDALPPTTVPAVVPYPNPSRGPVQISFTVDGPSTPVSIDIFDVGGRRVDTLVDAASFGPGTRSVSWDGRDAMGRFVASGTYFIRLIQRGTIITERLIQVP